METNKLSVYLVVTIDRMAVVNALAKVDILKTCHDFADSLVLEICKIATYYDEGRTRQIEIQPVTVCSTPL